MVREVSCGAGYGLRTRTVVDLLAKEELVVIE